MSVVDHRARTGVLGLAVGLAIGAGAVAVATEALPITHDVVTRMPDHVTQFAPEDRKCQRLVPKGADGDPLQRDRSAWLDRRPGRARGRGSGRAGRAGRNHRWSFVWFVAGPLLQRNVVFERLRDAGWWLWAHMVDSTHDRRPVRPVGMQHQLEYRHHLQLRLLQPGDGRISADRHLVGQGRLTVGADRSVHQRPCRSCSAPWPSVRSSFEALVSAAGRCRNILKKTANSMTGAQYASHL